MKKRFRKNRVLWEKVLIDSVTNYERTSNFDESTIFYPERLNFLIFLRSNHQSDSKVCPFEMMVGKELNLALKWLSFVIVIICL